MLAKTRLFGAKCVLCGLLPFQISSGNEKQPEKPLSIYDRVRYTSTGKERLYRMFSVDEVGSFSPELIRCYQATVFGAFVGATYGGYRSTKSAPVLKQTNTPVLKRTVHERNLSPEAQELFVNFIKGGFHWAWRVGLLCGSLNLLTTAISEYRGQSGILEYTAAGAVLGPCLGWKGGLKFMAMGGLLGIAIGTAGGCIMKVAHTIGGATTEENYFWQHGWKEAQLKHSRERLKKLKDERSLPLDTNEEACNSTNSNQTSDH